VTVLIVDDEPGDLDSERDALALAGYDILTADSAESAIEKFIERAGEIDVAVLDISLPGRNGVELFHELLKQNPRMRVLFVSGHVGAEVVRFYGLRTINRHFLKKPFAREALVERLAEIMNSPHQMKLQDFELPRPGASRDASPH
jgi:hypothetical protein